MGNYILIFKTTISTTFDRSKIIEKLYQSSRNIVVATVDIDDEDRILRIESSTSEIDYISEIMKKDGHNISFLAAFEQEKQEPIAIVKY